MISPMSFLGIVRFLGVGVVLSGSVLGCGVVSKPETGVSVQSVDTPVVANDEGEKKEVPLKSSPVDNPQTAQDWALRGKRLFDRQDWDGALVAFKKSVEVDPKCVHGYFGEGLVLMVKGDDGGTVAAFRKAFDISPSFKSQFEPLITALYETKDWDVVWREVERLKKSNIFLAPVFMDKIRAVTGRNS